MIEWIRKVLTRSLWVQRGKLKKLERVEVPPPEKLVLGIAFAITALIGLVIIEALHMIYLGSFNSEVFAAITLVIGAILGVFFGVRT